MIDQGYYEHLLNIHCNFTKDIVSGSQGSGIGSGGRTVERNTTTSYQKLESVSVGITASIANSAIHAISDCIVV